MSFISTLAEKFLVQPIAKRMISELEKSQKDPQAFQVPIGFNDMRGDANRRQTTGSSVTFQILRQLSVQHETTRAAINIRKRQINQLEWNIVDIDPEKGPSYSGEKIAEIKKQILHIGGPKVRFRSLLDKLIEDTLVIDALCFYKQRTRGGELLRIIPIDPTTIKLRVDQAGMTPLPPEAAFEQWIRGEFVTTMTTEELVYESMNPRTYSPYGLSPIEGMILTLDSSMRAMLYNLSYLSDNNIPQGFLSMPEKWTPNQIKEYKEYLDAMIAGPKDTAKVFPIPSGATYTPTTKPSDFAFKDFFDYLDRKVAMMFDLTPQELGLNLQQYKENAESQENIQMRKGLKPLAHFIEEIFTDVLQIDLGYVDLSFKFSGLETKFNYEDAKTLIPFGVVGIDEIRNDMGLKKLGVDPFIIAGNTITPVSQIGNTTVSGMNNKKEIAEDKNALDQELKAWETKAVNDMKKKGKVYRDFTSSIISRFTYKEISSMLQKAGTVDDVRAAFEKVKKKDLNVNPLDKAESSKKFKKFKEKMEQLLNLQVDPFTKVKNIEEVMNFSKIDTSIQSGVDIYFKSISDEEIITYMTWAADKGAEHAYSTLQIESAFKPNDKFIESLKKREQYLINSVDETTKEWLVREITNGKENALTNEEVARNIRDNFPDISKSRADTIVRTEVAHALQQGELYVYKKEGIEYKRWVLSEDIDDVCGINAESGPIAVNKSFPSGDDAPPAHPNCRCFIQAAFKEDL